VVGARAGGQDGSFREQAVEFTGVKAATTPFTANGIFAL
jgi:hypothetical protein